jgi:hypothetical protein
MAEWWTTRHFSLCNGKRDPTNLPSLLRRVADEIERMRIRPKELLDLTGLPRDDSGRTVVGGHLVLVA